MREHEHVRREPVPAEVRGLPEPVRRERAAPARRRAAAPRRAQHASRRPWAQTRTIGPATGSPCLEVDAGELVERAELLPDCGSAAPRRRSRRMTVTPRRRSGRRTRSTFPGNASSAAANGAGEPAVRDRVSPPRSAHLDEEPARSLRSRSPASGSPAASDDPEQVDARAHAGSLSASSRPRAGSIPSSAANARYSASAFAVSRPGRATARSRTFFGVCSSSTNSTHLHVVPDRAEQLRAGGVRHLGGEALPQRAVAEQRPERRALELGRSSCWQQGTARITGAPARTARSSASSVAVSQACRLTTRSTPASASYPAMSPTSKRRPSAPSRPRQRLAVGRRPRP